jgi:transcriptional regulator with XRE-family HTH domain
MENVENALERLYSFYNVANATELSKKINTSKKTISTWKIRNSINALKKKCKEIGIYKEIFENFEIIENLNLENNSNTSFEYYFKEFLNYFDVFTIKELSEKIGIPPSTISNWNQRKSITALKKAARELNIYKEIFKEITLDDFDFSKIKKIEELKIQCEKYGITNTTIKNKRLLYLMEQITIEAQVHNKINELEEDLINLFYKYFPLLNNYPMNDILTRIEDKKD